MGAILSDQSEMSVWSPLDSVLKLGSAFVKVSAKCGSCKTYVISIEGPLDSLVNLSSGDGVVVPF